MISLFKKIFSSNVLDLSDLIQKGAIIVDVRSKNEFESGHAKGSINIPLEQIASKYENLKNNSYIIVCCRTGNRSAMAERTLKSKGFKNVTNGGSWQNVNGFIN